LQKFLMRQFFPSNLLIIIISLIAVAALQFMLYNWLQVQHMFVNPFISLYTIITAFVILLVLWIVNFTTIRKYISLRNK